MVLGIDSVVSVCASDDNLIIPFEEKSGKLLQFAIQFKDNEMADVSAEGLSPENGAMVIPMIAGVKPNRYKATLSFGELACGGDDIARRSKYWVATDFMIKAKNADPALAEDADRSISQYRVYFPNTADAFMYNVTNGQSYTVSCGGMRATTTVRTNN